MHVQIWRCWARWALLEPSAWEYALFAIELLLSIAVLVVSYRRLIRLDRHQYLLFLGCLVASSVFECLLVVSFPSRNLPPPPGLPFAPAKPSAPLLGLVPVVIAGAWLGPGPGLLVGLVKGFLRAGMTAGGIAEPFHLGLFGILVGFLLRQDYCGRLPLLARQPIIAVPLASPFAGVLLMMSTFAHVADSWLSGLDYAVTTTGYHSAPLLLESLVAALVVQAFYLFLPQHRPVRAPRRPPPYSRSLNRRLLFLFIPVIGLMTIVLVCAVTAMALRLATSDAVNQMARDASSAAEEIPRFIQTGQGLLMAFGNDEGLWQTDEDALEMGLRRDMRVVVFFDQLILVDSSGQPLAVYPRQAGVVPELTEEEHALVERGFESGASQISSVHRSKQDEVILTFLAPMSFPSQSGQRGMTTRMLIGRTRLDVNPAIERILEGLQWTKGRGAGFIVDSRGRVVAHTNPDMLLITWEMEEGQPRVGSPLPGRAYESRDPWDNTRQLVYHLPAQGYSWRVVVRLPYDVVLEHAGRIAAPLLGLQILLGTGLVVIISLVTNWVTQPLKQLAGAADRIAEGDLSQPVEIRGMAGYDSYDEVARVGMAFDDMRLRLRHRLEDLSLLLEVSQSVSATLDLPEGLSFILEGALRATGAQVARIVLLSPDGDAQAVVSRGLPRSGLRSFDQTLARATMGVGRPITIEDVRRARTLLKPKAFKSAIESVIALPVHTQEQMAAVMWVGWDAARQFSDSELALLSTLASQTSVLVENARLFQAADGERRRLAAILASTTDAVVVTDRDNRILLVNPAAERVFDVRGESISGQPIGRTSLPLALVDIFREPLDPDQALTKELSLKDGRTLYANLSAIQSADGQCLGCVCVMRDITHLKELDELKSDFLAAVSHDLRAPLAFMRGYTEMLPAVGKLNQSQQAYLEQVLRGITRMSNLVNDLLDLQRIEANVDLESYPCDLGAILAAAVDSRRARAAEKDISLSMERVFGEEPDVVSEDGEARAAIVSGDAGLLRQAITNLVDNAIKYTPRGGQVVVRLSVASAAKGRSQGKSKRVLVHVSDTGIGIAREDQVRLFEKFYRVSHGEAPGVPGTGLGLSIVKSIVERHHGTVSVDSKLNHGSIFTINLPLIELSGGQDADEGARQPNKEHSE